MGEQGLGMVLVGLALLGFSATCWTRMWTSWLDAPQTPRSFFIATMPGLGICLLGFGFSTKLPPDPENAVGAVSGLVAIASVILGFWEPGWYGPRWRLARLHGTGGLLFFWPQAPVFAVGGRKVDIPVDEITPTESMRAARKLPPGTEMEGTVNRSGLRSWLVPRVYIDTADGPWLFQCRRAKHIARELERRYLDPSRDIYGLPLDKSSPPELEKGATSSEPGAEASQPQEPHSSGRPKAWRPRG